jgi:hypothetical protein
MLFRLISDDFKMSSTLFYLNKVVFMPDKTRWIELSNDKVNRRKSYEALNWTPDTPYKVYSLPPHIPESYMNVRLRDM